MIFGLFGFPRMEVTGAALATVTGQIIAAIAGVIVNMKLNKELHISLVKYKISGDVIRSIYSVEMCIRDRVYLEETDGICVPAFSGKPVPAAVQYSRFSDRGKLSGK